MSHLEIIENCIVCSGHGLSDGELTSWFSEHICEATAYLIEHSDGDTRFVDLMLENEVEVAIHRFQKKFPEATARRPLPGERPILHAVDSCRPSDNLQLRFGSAAACCPGVTLSVELPYGPGLGTGGKLWSGGILLAEWLARGSEGLDVSGKDVLELGAGCAALPCLVLASQEFQCYSGQKANSLVASDALAGAVGCCSKNACHNSQAAGLPIECRRFDWVEARHNQYRHDEQFDVILFADCIYTERGAWLLADAIMALLRPGGTVIGCFPHLRVGISSFEEDMEIRGYTVMPADLDAELLGSAASICTATPDLALGDSLDGYRLVRYCSNKSEVS
eukprot:TRINITY_DN61885_c0_g1_i1.p1 TRINITY_DN61885_c0_g1~~TRINITY_DN61885_c0_g1_i1.p1  ORF type:complete len:336 (+),score=40.01 TRINITY_DN61885_c0_g1_i1:162-1169(+)